MEERLREKIWFKMIPIGLVLLAFLFSFIMLCCNLKPDFGGKSFWSTASVYYNKNKTYPVFCLSILIIFGIQCLFYGLGTFLTIKKKRMGLWIVTIFNLIYGVAVLFINIYIGMLAASAIVCLAIFLLLMIGSIIMLILIESGDISKNEVIVDEEPEEEMIKAPNKILLLIFNIISFIAVCTVFFVPLYTTKSGSNTMYLISAIKSSTFDAFTYILFLVFFIAIFFTLLSFVVSIAFYYNSKTLFLKKTRNAIVNNTIITFVFFLMGYFLVFYYNLKGIASSTISYIPLILMVIVLLTHSIVLGKYSSIDDTNEILKKEKRKFKVEPLVFVAILTFITILSNVLNIVEVDVIISGFTTTKRISGFELLKDYAKLGGGFQLIAFIIFAISISTITMLVVTIVSFFSKSHDYYKVTKVSAIFNSVFMFFIGMSGIYYKIVQKMNEESINELLEYFGLNNTTQYSYNIKSQTIYAFIASVVVLLIMIIRGSFNYKLEDIQEVSATIKSNDEKIGGNSNAKEKPMIPSSKEVPDFDACPAFSELDYKKSAFENDLLNRQVNSFENPTLPELVRFVVDYARESRLHLSYSSEDIANFVAGLGASRLSILQGMSGTGKTSLPKIFIEAIMGNCDIIEVESSWRDKNELIGYYNEFSKSFTPKKFTQALYKAKLNPYIPTFIVLDEMNLSRIEYYFSDFLSLMEHEEDKREIKLLNVKLFRTINQEKCSYLGLDEGHTLKIPTNVWFIGTANRDESTFEISDKVYDRAQTMNFNRRAPKISSYNKPIPPKFLPYYKLNELLTQAKQNKTFDAEGNELVQACERILQPYNISFGNRVLKQIEEFVTIYCACFGDGASVLDDAIERILLSKVVSKLEFKNVEDKDELAVEFDEANLHKCAAFVRKLNED